MKLALSIPSSDVSTDFKYFLLSGSFEERVKKLSRFGFEGAEILPANPAGMDTKYMKKVLDDCGVEACALATAAVKALGKLRLLAADRQDMRLGYDSLKRLIESAYVLKTPVITVGSFRGNNKDVGGKASELLSSIIHSVDSDLKSAGVKLAIEPVNKNVSDYLNTVDQVIDFINFCGSENVGILMDTFNADLEENCAVEAFSRAYRTGKLIHVHVADNERLNPGEGEIDFPGVIKAINGYIGYYSAELNHCGNPDEQGKKISDYFRSIN